MPGAERSFIDSNIVLYALDTDVRKHDLAWDLLFTKPVVSIQVLNECSNVLSRKRKWSIEQIAETLDSLLQFVSVESTDVATVRSAWKVQGRYGFSYYDSLIIATALAADCTRLYSEDMQHGQVIAGRLTIIDPFSEEAIM
ncbi:MAG: PIN domain-containing protein [Methylomicrobium sp.]